MVGLLGQIIPIGLLLALGPTRIMSTILLLTSARPTRSAAPTAAQKGAAAYQDATLMAVELLPFTVPEVRRLLLALVWQPPPLAAQILHWSTWRRRHQAQAKRAHIRRRQRLA